MSSDAKAAHARAAGADACIDYKCENVVERVRELAEMALAQGVLRHSVALRLPLERIAEAHEVVESGAVIGNVVIDLQS